MFPSHKRVFVGILPNLQGLFALLGIVVLFVIAAVYAEPHSQKSVLLNGIGMLLTLTYLVGMIQTSLNLRNLKIVYVKVEPIEAGKMGFVKIGIQNQRSEPQFLLNLRLKFGKVKTISHFEILPTKKVCEAVLSVPTAKRGIFKLSPLIVSTEFSVGLFYAWTHLELNQSYIVYPKPLKPQNSLPISSIPHEDEFEHRRFEQGDLLSRVDWKAHARGLPLMSKKWAIPKNKPFKIDWGDFKSQSGEQKLSILAFVCLDCYKNKRPYVLKLPQVEVPLGHSKSHLYASLTELAVFNLESQA